MDFSNVALSLLIALGWGIIPIIQKYVLSTVSVITVFVVGSFIYFSGTLLIFAYNRHEVLTNIPKLNLKLWGMLIFSGIFCAMLTNMLFIRLLKTNSSYIVTALSYTSPVFTMLLGYMILSERITIMSFIGVILIVSGIVLLVFQNKKESFVNIDRLE